MNYLILSNVSLALFAFLYWGILRRVTFFQANRVYFLVMLIGSAVIPLIEWPTQIVSTFVVAPVVLPEFEITQTATSSGITVATLLLVVYWLGVLLSFGRLLASMVLLIVKGLRSQSGYLAKDGTHAFSFFAHVHIGEEIDADLRTMIEKHEAVHVQQWHSLDVLLYEIAKAFFWFNPLIHLIAREVRQNHEFIADQIVANDFGVDYQYSLLDQALSTNTFRLANSFISKSMIKNRILMMNKIKSGKWSKATYLLVLPLVAGMLWLSACSQQPGVPEVNQTQTELSEAFVSKPNEVLKAEEVDVKPEFPGGQEAMWDYFREGFTYPEALKENNVEGKVTIAFTVNEDGSISDLEAVQSDDERLEDPAIDFLKLMPNWNPGQKDGTPVKVKMLLPVMYSMN